MERVCVHAARALLLATVVCLPAAPAAASFSERTSYQPPPSEAQTDRNQPVLGHLTLEGASVYSRDDVLWLLDLREGAPLPKTPAEVAAALQDRYARDGYTEARVEGRLEGSDLTLRVDEGRIDDVELVGVGERQAATLRRRLAVRPGDVYNKRTIGQAIDRLVDDTQDGLVVGRPRRNQPGGHRLPDTPDAVVLERRGGRNVLVVPLRWRQSRVGLHTGADDREDMFSPVDGFAPAVGFTATIYDHNRFNHTVIDGYASYKFGREALGYTIGLERPLFSGPKLFLGAELHDISASDDLWRISPAEQTLVSFAFKNTFRDYYRRRGAQMFGVFQPGLNNEFLVMARWDRHAPLENATDFSLFRDDETFRVSPPVKDQDVAAWIVGYTFDTRPMTGAGEPRTYQRHLHDSLFGFGLRQGPGLRLEWTSELAGKGVGGDARFDRHILNLRGYLAFSDRQLLAMRGVVGGSGGDLPIERRFSLGGIGTVHGYRFKQESGTGMALFNAEYRVRLSRGVRRESDGIAVFGFYDTGRVTGPLGGSTGDWLQGLGFGVGVSGFRVEFGFRSKDIPSSRQVLVRLGPTF